MSQKVIVVHPQAKRREVAKRAPEVLPATCLMTGGLLIMTLMVIGGLLVARGSGETGLVPVSYMAIAGFLLTVYVAGMWYFALWPVLVARQLASERQVVWLEKESLAYKTYLRCRDFMDNVPVAELDIAQVQLYEATKALHEAEQELLQLTRRDAPETVGDAVKALRVRIRELLSELKHTFERDNT